MDDVRTAYSVLPIPKTAQSILRKSAVVVRLPYLKLGTKTLLYRIAVSYQSDGIADQNYLFHIDQPTNSLTHLSYAATGSAAAVMGLPTTM